MAQKTIDDKALEDLMRRMIADDNELEYSLRPKTTAEFIRGIDFETAQRMAKSPQQKQREREERQEAVLLKCAIVAFVCIDIAVFFM